MKKRYISPSAHFVLLHSEGVFATSPNLNEKSYSRPDDVTVDDYNDYGAQFGGEKKWSDNTEW